MFSLVRQLKETTLALRLLCLLCRRRLGHARLRGDTKWLADHKALYAIERRVLAHLDAKSTWGLDASTPPAMRRAYDVLREALAWLIENGPGEDRRFFNRKLNHLEKTAKAERLLSYPVRAYYETTNRCNLRCPMCGQSFFKGERGDMPREALARLSPLFQWFDELSIFGYGETLLIDHLGELLDAIPPHPASRLVTNGILLKPEMSRLLVDKGLKILFISIDAVEAATYKAIRGVDKFEEVKANIRDLAAYRSQKGARYPELTLTFVAMKRNVAQLAEFVRMAKSLGVENVIADYLTVFSEDMREQSLFYHQELSDRCVAQAVAAARDIGIAFTPPATFSAPAGAASRRRCYEPWEFVYFRSDGAIQPCCTNSDVAASWRDGGFRDAWNSPAYHELRRTIGTPAEPGWCRDCVHVSHRDIRLESAHVHIMPESKNELP